SSDVCSSDLEAWREIGEALIRIRDKDLYRDRYATFESYCQDRWSLARRTAYQMIEAVRLCAIAHITNPEQAKALAPALNPKNGGSPERVREVYSLAQERSGKEQPTAKEIRAARKELEPPKDEGNKPGAPSGKYDVSRVGKDALDRIYASTEALMSMLPYIKEVEDLPDKERRERAKSYRNAAKELYELANLVEGKL